MKKAIIFDWVGTLWKREQGIFPFAKGVLDKLKPNYKVGLISRSSKDIEKRLKEIKNSGIEEYFDSIIVEGEKTKKQFKKCLKEMEVKPKDTIVVGDRASREIQIGNILGCTTIWIRIGDRSFDSPNKETGQPKHIINSIKDLLNLI